MIEFLKFAGVWILFMVLVAIICLVTPKIAPPIERLFKSLNPKKSWKNPYDISDDLADGEQNNELKEEKK